MPDFLPPVERVEGPSDATSLTPRGGNRRSFRAHCGLGFPAPIGRLLHDDIEAGVAFDGVLPPDSASVVGGKLRFPGPWHSRAPRNASWTAFLSGTAGLVAVGKPEWSARRCPDVSLKSVINGKM